MDTDKLLFVAALLGGGFLLYKVAVGSTSYASTAPAPVYLPGTTQTTETKQAATGISYDAGKVKVNIPSATLEKAAGYFTNLFGTKEPPKPPIKDVTK